MARLNAGVQVVAPPEPEPEPETTPHQRLAAAQAAIVLGQRAEDERRRLLLELWENGETQRELADVLTAGSQSVGGEAVTENAVYKALAKLRRRADAMIANGHKGRADG